MAKPKEGAVLSAANSALSIAQFQGCDLSVASLTVANLLLQSLASFEFYVRAVIVAAPNKSIASLHISTTEGII